MTAARDRRAPLPLLAVLVVACLVSLLGRPRPAELAHPSSGSERSAARPARGEHEARRAPVRGAVAAEERTAPPPGPTTEVRAPQRPARHVRPAGPSAAGAPAPVLAGRVTGPRGASVPRFCVWAVPLEAAPAGGDVSRAVSEVVRTVDGRFVLVDLEPGAWRLAVETREGSSGPVDVTLPLEGELELSLRPAASLAGTVRDPRGRPAARARVVAGRVAPDPPAWRVVLTDDEGAFRIDALAAGRWALVARKLGFAEGTPLELELTAGSAGPDVVLSLR